MKIKDNVSRVWMRLCLVLSIFTGFASCNDLENAGTVCGNRFSLGNAGLNWLLSSRLSLSKPVETRPKLNASKKLLTEGCRLKIASSLPPTFSYKPVTSKKTFKFAQSNT